MRSLIVNNSQTELLKVKDVLQRINCRTLVDGTTAETIEFFEIRSIKITTTILELAMTGTSIWPFAAPWQIGRLFIKRASLIAEGIWWIDRE